MKRIILVFIGIALVISCKKTKPLVIIEQNHFTAIVNDFSRIFTQSQRDSLTIKIIQFESKTTNEIAIITLDSIDGDIGVYATHLANKIGIGKKDKDNGVLILLVKPLRQVWIGTGYGTEKILTDSVCKVIIDTKMISEFKKGNFYKGIDIAVDEIILKWIDND